MAIVTDSFHPAVNGVVRSVTSTVRALEDLGAEVRVFAPATRSTARRLANAGVTFVPAMESSIYPGLHLGLVPIRPAQLAAFDVVHVHTPGPLGLSAIAAARAARVPVVFTYHTRFDELLHRVSSWRWAQGLLARGVRRADRKILGAVDAVVAPTKAVAVELAAKTGVRAHVVASGLDGRFCDPGLRDPARGRAFMGLPPDAGPVVLHVGRISREKGLDRVIRAMVPVLEQEPGAHLVVAGTGPDQAEAEALVRQLGLGHAVRFVGFVPEDLLPSVYAAADVFVTASRFETQGLTMLEAMACGAPVACADSPVFAAAIRGGAAVPFDPDHPQDVAGAVLQAHRLGILLQRRGAEIAAGSTPEAAASRLLRVYSSVARVRAPSRWARLRRVGRRVAPRLIAR